MRFLEDLCLLKRITIYFYFTKLNKKTKTINKTFADGQ